MRVEYTTIMFLRNSYSEPALKIYFLKDDQEIGLYINTESFTIEEMMQHIDRFTQEHGIAV